MSVKPKVTREDDYIELEPLTKSELAVPIKDEEGRLRGVLNLESNISGTFTSADIWELATFARSITPHLISRHFARMKRLPWNFDLHGWSLNEVLSDFCFHVASVLEECGTKAACSIWHYDTEKQCLVIRATSGFDFGYLSTRRLPAKSFLGTVAERCHGETFRGHWHDFEAFVAKEKAERMGLQRVVATPIVKSGDTVADGVFNVYYFKDYADDICITDTLIRHIADEVARAIRLHGIAQRKVATEYFRHQLLEHSPPSHAAFPVILNVCREILGSEIGSIFARKRNKPDEFVCVATSGLEREGGVVETRDEAVYDISSEADDGFTTYLAKTPGGLIRKNDIPDESEPGIPDDLRPKNKLRESFAVSDTEHRRFLGLSVCSRIGGALGVIRLLRGPDSRPYLKSDGELAQHLTSICTGAFEEWQDGKVIDEYLSVKANDLGLSLRTESGAGGESRLAGDSPDGGELVSAIARLLRPVPRMDSSRERLVQDCLQSTLAIFRDYGAILASIREVVPDVDGVDRLKMVALHSRNSSEQLDEKRYLSERREEPSNAWRCLATRKLVTFVRREGEEYFKPVHPDSDKVKSGICIPFATWTEGRCIEWACCVDFARPVTWEPAWFEVLHHTVRKLAVILGGGVPPIYLPARDFFKAFLARGARTMDAEWSELALATAGQQDRSVVAEYGEKGDGTWRWKPATGDAGKFGVRWDEDSQRTYSIPLRMGAYTEGHYQFRVPDTLCNKEVARNVQRVIQLWARYAGFSVAVVPSTAPYWEVTFRAEPADFSGGTYWNSEFSLQNVSILGDLPLRAVSSDESPLEMAG